ncbi:LOW QUALITY PROTEIN: eukaryotic translation initiation factor 4 gamma 2 [Phymastichus coffea]|uniref:LOW QUALITY PROTEIN: eukaryotic translation initiation factor 4 gamma 2 n=1 Tax=Phymastichus coffea TaxID=108790 RepID=UPI00273BA32D|nr:LOW QUALITY PROTEIN: eukaryotic translation initiation factor 4 gamma 2 [Phymastichus coffea]
MPSRDDNRSLSTEQRWIPPSTIRRDALTPESRNDVIFRKVRGILNKLTPEKFAKLSNDLLNLELNSDVILKGVIFLIFEKALDEPKYSSMYAQLCKRLSEESANFENTQKQGIGSGSLHQQHQQHQHQHQHQHHRGISSATSAAGGNNHNHVQHQHQQEAGGKRSNDSTFTRLLLNKCRVEFENRSKANEAFELKQGELSAEDEERRQNAKRKMLGNIKFIGELGKLEIVSNSILHRCIQQLLDKRRGGSRGDQAEDIECLCQIMRTCGRILDTDKGALLMEQYFKRMSVLAKNSELPLRIRFMLRDCIELRQNGWVPRKATSTEGPMPINQIRNDNDDHPGRQGHLGLGGHQGGGGGGHSGPGSFYNRNRGDDPGSRGMNSDLFRRMGRVSFDVDNLGIIPLTSAGFAMSSPFSPNGFGPPQPPAPTSNTYGPGRHNQRNQPPANFYPNQNRNQNNYQGKHNQQQHNSPQNFNNNGNKESVRFNKHKLIGPPEEISLRPSANSMTFKQPNINPNITTTNGGIDLFPGRIPESPLMRAAAMRKPSPPLIPKDPPATVVIKQAPLDKQKRERKDKGPTKEEVMKKVNALMDDFVSHGNIPNAITAFKELKIPERFLRWAVHTIYSNGTERNDAERTLAANLVSQMRKENVINAQQFHDGWKELVNSIAEKESAVPCIASHTAQLTARAIIDGMMQLADLAAVTENGQHYPLFLLTLQQLHKIQDKQTLMEIFNDSKVNLISQLPEAEKTKERLGEILEDRDLTFLYPLLRIQGDMWKQLESDPSPNSLYKWIKEKLDPSHHSDPGFINALMTVLLKYITQETTFPLGTNPAVIPDKSLQEKEVALLSKYQRMLQTLLPTIESQVTAVHSLQVFCLSQGFPKGMLLRWFIALYDLSIIDEDAFMRWKEDVNDAYPGKGDALFQVNAWLTWLAEQPSEDEDEEEDEKGDN